jgi:hypothetical protein
VQVYGLWPLALDRLAKRTGKVYSFLVATVAAKDANDARRYAVEQDEKMSLPWDDPNEFECKEVAIVGDLPPEGRVLYQWTPEAPL